MSLRIARGKEGLEKLQQECRNIKRHENVNIFPFDLLNGDYTSDIDTGDHSKR